MSRRSLLAGIGGCAAVGRAPAGRRRPNVVFMFSDEHRYQSMSFTETPQVRTPNMARMARDGVSFTHAISNYPVCSPYRAMLLTGRWPYRTGVIDNDIPLRPEERTLGKAFRDAGYRTAYIGKWHLGGTRAEPFGFDESLIWERVNDHYDRSVYFPRGGDPVQPKGYNATLMTDQALRFIEDRGSDPYLLVLSVCPPHSKFTDAPPEKRALYPDGSIPYRANATQPGGSGAGPAIVGQNGPPYYEGYHAHITAVDDELGRVLAAVERSPRADDTVIVYASDHGSQFGSHGVGGKRQPYEESIRVPFLVYGPGVVRHGAVNELFGAVDIMPTLCGLAGIRPPASCEGRDYSGYLRRGRGPRSDAQLIMHIAKEHASGGVRHPAPIFRGVRTRQHTYVVLEDGTRLLYDLAADPLQMHNLAQDERMAGTCARLHARVASLLRAAGDPFRLPRGA